MSRLEMTIYRRHLISCSYRGAGRDINRCKCPIWVQGVAPDGSRIRRTLKTSDWKTAGRELSSLESGQTILSRTVKECLDAWFNSLHIRESTRANYVQAVKSFKAFCEKDGPAYVADVNFEVVERWRNSLSTLAPISINRMHSVLNIAFNWLQTRGWMRNNPGRGLKKLKVQPADRDPYTQDEVARLFAACDQIGKTDYERRRAKAMMYVLYYTGLRISDVAMLAKDRVKDGRLQIRTRKTGEVIDCQLPDVALAALAALPEPRSSHNKFASPSPSGHWMRDESGRHPRFAVSAEAGNSISERGKYFFWNGVCKPSCQSKMASHTLAAVFKKAGFERTLLHRFRHTLASRVLAKGGTIEDVAELLGNTPAVAHKHYSRYSREWQKRLDGILKEATAIEPEKPVIEQMQPVSKEIQ